MRHFNSSIAVQQGTTLLFSDYADGGPMWTGNGTREVRRHVEFEQGFEKAPAVMVGLSMWDMDRETNARVDLVAESITSSGFELVFRTWGDSRIARVRASWTAIGSLMDEEVWQVG